jgi:hypothetical protein
MHLKGLYGHVSRTNHDMRQRASNAVVQASLAYSRIVEQHDMEGQMKALERLAQGNGHA